ncbi:hypothetical protein CHUAL_003911 [Chamberlinius hualienensis]
MDSRKFETTESAVTYQTSLKAVNPFRSYDINPAYYVIFNNTDVRCEENEDVQIIKKTFKKLGFNGESYYEKSITDIKAIIKEILDEKDRYGSLFVFILTFAEKDFLLKLNQDSYDFYGDIIHTLISNEGPGLVGKPKVFVVQAYETDSHEFKDEDINKQPIMPLIPQFADLFLAISYIPVKIEQKVTVKPWSFIRALADIISEDNRDSSDFESLLTELRRRRLETSGAIPISVSTLTQLLYLK